MEEKEITFFMREALLEAKKALEENEVPVGAVVVKNGGIIGRGHNHREAKNAIYSHAEIEAILDAEKVTHSWTLSGSALFVTVEPCLMCAGAIKQARITSLYYGCQDPSMGAVRSHYHVFDDSLVENSPLVYCGILENESKSLMQEFFSKKR